MRDIVIGRPSNAVCSQFVADNRKGVGESAGINRHGVADGRAAQEGVAHHLGSESCASVRKGAGEALTGILLGGGKRVQSVAGLYPKKLLLTQAM